MTERRRTLFIAFAVGNLAVTSAADLMQRPTFLARTDLVHLDVSVLDDQRRPIRGLAASDFTVLEDGEPRDIAAFAAVDVPPPVRTGQWTAEIGSDVQTTEADEDPHGRLFAVVIDDAMMPNDLKMLESAKRIARSVIDHTSGSDQSAVIFTAGSAGAQPFTTDRARLRAAIETLRTGHATYGLGWDTPLWINPPGRWAQSIDGDVGYRAGSFETLKMIAGALMAAPQRRKALIFVSPGIAIDAESAARPRIPSAKEGNVAAMLAAKVAANTSMRPVEVKHLRRRVIPLNASAIEAAARMFERADQLGHTAPEHYLWPACQWGRFDATNPMLKWDTAWRALRDAAGQGYAFTISGTP